MLDTNRNKIEPTMTSRGTQRMVARLVYAEPELWDTMARMGGIHGHSRSTTVRRAMKLLATSNIKGHKNISGVDWSEFSDIGK